MTRLATIGLYLIATSATTLHVYAQNTTAPSVSLNVTGTVIGNTNAAFGVDQFLGIPYAQAPIGNLRYAAPVPLVADPTRVIQAQNFGPACLQAPSTNIPLAAMSEDCLTINVVRPAGLNATAKLPVMAWVYGGSFLSGGSALYNPAVMIGTSLKMNEPIVYVSFNYRVNSFGFLGGSEMAKAAKTGNAALNAGLYDIRAALLWVQQNIDAFGGDHAKVTVFGESAGAMSIGSLLVADKGKAVKKLNLFRGAILESGAPSGDGVVPPAYLESAFTTFATAVGCSSASLANGTTSLQCLRAVPAVALFNATLALLSTSTAAVPFNRVQDGYFHDTAPSIQVRGRRVARVPILTDEAIGGWIDQSIYIKSYLSIGNNLDEGTLFSATVVQNASEIIPYYEVSLYDANASKALAQKLLPEALRLYPDIAALGSPFNPINASKSDRFYGPENQYKRIAAMTGDSVFQTGRRLLIDQYISRDKNYPVYNYLFTAPTPGTAAPLGIYHSSEIKFVYGAWAYANPTNSTGLTSAFMTQAWVAFANNLKPNRPYLPVWPKYGSNRQTLQIGPVSTKPNSTTVTKVIKDTYRQAGIAFFGSEAWTSQVNV